MPRRDARSGGRRLLHNMSMRPRTAVRWEVPPLFGDVVHFDLRACRTSAARVLRSARAQRRRGDAHLVDRLEQAWGRWGLCGAALFFGASEERNSAAHDDAWTGRRTIRATDPLLVINVLARARSRLLCADTPLALEKPFLQRTLATDDPRLVALARETGTDEKEAT